MDSKIGFEINLIAVEAIRGRCASFTVLTATVSEIFGGQTTPSILVTSIDLWEVTIIYSHIICRLFIWFDRKNAIRQVIYYPVFGASFVQV